MMLNRFVGLEDLRASVSGRAGLLTGLALGRLGVAGLVLAGRRGGWSGGVFGGSARLLRLIGIVCRAQRLLVLVLARRGFAVGRAIPGGLAAWWS